MKSVQLVNDDFKGHVDTVRFACRGIAVQDGCVLLSHETADDRWLIPGGGMADGETPKECCEREMLEETGFVCRAGNNYLDIEELFDVWRHTNHYFECEVVSESGEMNLTEREAAAGCTKEWVPIDRALELFGEYERYRSTDIALYGLYRREYTALRAFAECKNLNETGCREKFSVS